MTLAGCGSSSLGGTGGGTTTGSGGGDAGPPTPVWTAFASRGSDSRWGVPLAYSTKAKTFIGFSGSQYPASGPGGTFALSMATGAWAKLTDSAEPAPSYCSRAMRCSTMAGSSS